MSKKVTKNSGEQVPFNEDKLRHSLTVSGAQSDTIAQIIREVKNRLYEGMPTSLIYQYAFDVLKKMTDGVASRYKLKKAIMELGPSGYSFEQFMGVLMTAAGFRVQVGIIQQGCCVQHEIDVLAENEQYRYMMECKYHNQLGTKSDVKIPLYIHSRFLDVSAKWQEIPDIGHKKWQGWVVTNTRFTEDAIQYANCVGLGLLGWDYPATGNLKERIEQTRLYPITCLTTLTTKEKQWLMERKIVLCNELTQHKDKLLNELHIPARRFYKLQQEIESICFCHSKQ